MSWKLEIEYVGKEGKWASNAIRFATKEEALSDAHSFRQNWLMENQYRVTESTDPVSHRWENGRLIPLDWERDTRKKEETEKP
jgi:hypothetical protein